MKIPQLARYNGSVFKAYEFVEQNMIEYPANLFVIIKNLKWGLLTYEELALKWNCTINDVCDCLGSDGYSIYNGRNYTIAYNNTQKAERIQFTLAHEIGHIILKHHKDFNGASISEDNFTKEEYKILENEANCFARNILAPAPLTLKIPFLFRSIKLKDIFNISFSAQNTRISFLSSDLNYLTSTQIFNMQQKYDAYLDCKYCKQSHLNTSWKFCPSCGNSKLKKGNGLMIYKNNIETDENKKVTICPRCNNEEISDGNYCKICGLELFNRCISFEIDSYGNYTGCSDICDANARYCTHCGQKTTFFEKGLLCDYKNYKKPANASYQELWKNRINNLKSENKIMLYSNLFNTELLDIDNHTVGINFINGLTPFVNSVVNTRENIDFINIMIKEIYGIEKIVKFYSKNIETTTSTSATDELGIKILF